MASEWMLRCPLCANLDHEAAFNAFLRCKLCSLLFQRNGGAFPELDSYKINGSQACFPNWNNGWTRLTRHLPDKLGKPFYFSLPTVHMFAARQGRRASSVRSGLPLLSDTFVPWSFGPTLRATIDAPWKAAGRTGPDPRLTLGIIATGHAWQEVIDLCGAMASQVAETVVILDTPDAAIAAKLVDAVRAAQPARDGAWPRVIAHPLCQDFAAQRNRIQQASRTEWVLQLDCDESLPEKARNLLSGILDYAEHEGWHAVALARCNLVDGVVSALYPDAQYRLLRRSVRFTRAVHEYPALRRNQPAFVHLGAPILHTIDSARLARRETLYEAIHKGAGRPDDTALLRMKLPDDVERAA